MNWRRNLQVGSRSLFDDKIKPLIGRSEPTAAGVIATHIGGLPVYENVNIPPDCWTIVDSTGWVIAMGRFPDA